MSGLFAAARTAARDFGWAWLIRRGWYEAQVRSGSHRLRFRRRSWAEDELSHWLKGGQRGLAWAASWREKRRPHFVDDAVRDPRLAERLTGLLGYEGVRALREEAEAALRGSIRYFSNGFSPPQEQFDWHRNPFTGEASTPSAHWTRIPMYAEASGDLKFIWEPGRFSVAYVLVRAWGVTRDERYAEGFWQWALSWGEANPPNQGAHWKCGQETSFRLMAWAFALHAFANCKATTPERVARLVGMMAVQADRVAKDRIYSFLQTNNHSVSEGVGLWLMGLLFPDLAAAKNWRKLGREILEADAIRLMSKDGSFVQKSTNYHRVMLHDYLYAIRLAETNGETFARPALARVEVAVDWLVHVLDRSSGRVPNLGANDGALVLPLNGCDYGDFRPVAEAGARCFDRLPMFSRGPWHEDILWLMGPAALPETSAADCHAVPGQMAAEEGGYYTLRGRDTWALVRCPAFKDRPGQADVLHLDLWRHGENVALDAGTFLYYAAPPWANSLASSLVHNTVTVDGLEQMQPGPRFMWLGWLKAARRGYGGGDGALVSYFEGEHDGYARLEEPVTHRRAVLRVGEDIWIIVDELPEQSGHRARLHWLLPAVPFERPSPGRLRLSLRQGAYDFAVFAGMLTHPIDAVVRQGEDSDPLGGWYSPRYGLRVPALSASWEQQGTPLRFISVFCPPETELTAISPVEVGLKWKTGRAVVTVQPIGGARIVERVHVESDQGGLQHFQF